ncbi:MAG: tetratricopeptide repeat protein [Desulfobulbaceae bacterium]|nr:tetratricopeptide repeat protein [Desulfobulbaceae bacterium]
MTSTKMSFAILSSVVLIAVLPLPTRGETKIEKAQKLIKVERYQEAERFLEQAIVDDPTNPTVHFAVGRVYLDMGRDSQAEETFSVLVRKLDPTYAHKVGELFRNRGDTLLQREDSSAARTAYERAMRFSPDLRTGVSQRLVKLGKDQLKSKGPASAESNFSIAYAVNPGIGTSIHEAYYQLALEASDETCLPLYQMAKKYSDTHDREIAARFIRIAKGRTGEARKGLKQQFQAFLNEAEFGEAFPPPVWKTVFQRKYEGRGMGDNDYLKTVQNGTDYEFGDQTLVYGDEFDVWYDGGWKHYDRGAIYKTVNQSTNTGTYLGVKAPLGSTFNVEIQRLSE